MRRAVGLCLVLVTLTFLTASLVASAAEQSTGWEIGLGLGPTSISSPSYTAQTLVFTDVWDDDYALTARQVAIDNPVALVPDIRTPNLLRLGPVYTRLRATGAIVMGNPSAVNGSSSYLGLVCIGPLFELPVDKGSIEAGVYSCGANASFVACRMPSAWPGDPGYGTSSGDFIAPGTGVIANADATGPAFSVGMRWPLSAHWQVRVQALTISDLVLREYTYRAECKYGGESVKFPLPQLEPIDLSGIYLSAGITYEF